jgi:hypothetical protein
MSPNSASKSAASAKRVSPTQSDRVKRVRSHNEKEEQTRRVAQRSNGDKESFDE